MSKTISPYPGFSARMLAHNIDLVILLPFFYLMGYFVSDNWTLFGLCFGFYVLYHSIFEMTAWKATPGKKLQHMRVVDENGRDLKMGFILLRNLVKLISVILLFAGVVMIAVDKKHRALHDRVTGACIRFYR